MGSVMALRVLIACTEPRSLQDLEVLLGAGGYEVFCASDPDQAEQLVNACIPDVILWGLEDTEGAPSPGAVARQLPGSYLVAIGGADTAALADRAARPGVCDALAVPCTEDELRLLMLRAGAWCRAQRELRLAHADLARSAAERPIVGASPAMIELLEAIERAAGFRACVLLRGEPGTGKEGLARAIHSQSDRRAGPFVRVACREPDQDAAMAALFGRRGGTAPPRTGAFIHADGGTLLLDDVDSLSLPCQERLLTVLQGEAVSIPGADKPRRVDVRVLSAATRNLRAAASDDPFLEDLRARLASVELSVPPLRERPEDIPLLLDHFTDRASRALGLARPTVADDALERLVSCRWPGNVREFQNVIERAVLLARGGRITSQELPERLAAGGVARHDLALRPAKKRLELDMIRRALRETGGNRTHAATLLRISHRALLYKLKEYGITS
jgi:two-component system response regulator AtoC